MTRGERILGLIVAMTMALGLPIEAQAVVVCQKAKNPNKIKLRPDVCKRNEVQVFLDGQFAAPAACGADESLRWDGTNWACVPVAAVPTACGADESLTWDGTNWACVPVAAVPTACGTDEALSWDGTSWACVKLPEPTAVIATKAETQVGLPNNGGRVSLLRLDLSRGYYLVQAAVWVTANGPSLVTCRLVLDTWTTTAEDVDTRVIDGSPFVGDPHRLLLSFATHLIYTPLSVELSCEATGGGEDAVAVRRSITATKVDTLQVD